MAIDIIASVIPNIQQDKMDSDRFSFFIYLTPRISCSGIQTLDDFRQVYHWTDCLDFFGQAVEFSIFSAADFTRAPQTIKATAVQDKYRCDNLMVTDDWKANENGSAIHSTQQSSWRRTIWRGMFGPTTPVNGWELDKTAYNLVKKLNLSDLNDSMNHIIQKAKEQLLANPLGDLNIPGIYDDPEEETRQKNSLIAILDYLYDLTPDRKLHSSYLQAGSSLMFPGFLKDIYDQLVSFSNNRDQEILDTSFKLTLPQVTDRNNTQMNEFHNKMAAFGNFPFLLKQTGWIWEYRVPKKEIREKLNGKTECFMQAKFKLNQVEKIIEAESANKNPDSSACKPTPTGCFIPDERDFIESVNFVYPVTAISVKGEVLDYGFMKKTELPYPTISDGFILKDEHYRASMEFVEKNQVFDRMGKILKQNYSFSYDNAQATGANAKQQQLKTATDAQLAKNQTQLQVAGQEYLQQQKEKAEHPVPSDYNSSGFSVHFINVKDVVNAAVQANPGASFSALTSDQKKSLVNANALIYGHNVHKGYRPDIFWNDDHSKNPDAETFSRPLCQRRVYYTIDFRKYNPEDNECLVSDPPCIVDVDEGWVIESAQNSNSGNLYLDEELFRYNDYSLSADTLIRASQLEANEKAIAQNSFLEIFSVPVAGSLPLLRFGRRYSLALRFADICGGGRQPLYKDNYTMGPPNVGKPPIITEPARYPRTQGIGAPLLFLGHYLHPNGERSNDIDRVGYLDQRTGQDLQTMVIRSAYDRAADDLIFEPATITTRYIGPPKLDFQLVKKHGVFDAVMQFASTVSTQNDPNNNPENQEIVRQTYIQLMNLIPPPLANPDKKETDNPIEEIITGPNQIDYLFDPLVYGYQISVNGIPEESPWKFGNPVLDATSKHQLYIEGVTFLPLRLDQNLKPSEGDYWIDEVSHTVYLSMGVQKRMEIQTELITDLIVFRDGQSSVIPLKLKELLYDSEPQVNKISLQVIHAVQKPCLLYANKGKKRFQSYYPGQVFPLERKPGDTMISISFNFNLYPCFTAEAYILHATYNDIVSCKKRFLPDGSINFDGFLLKSVDRVIRSNCQPDRANVEQLVRFSELSHTFNDAKYRSICYTLEAVSKFKKYFPESVVDFSITGSHEKPVAILSSIQPPAIEVDRIVPLIRWEGNIEGEDGLERNCDTVRIYLKGDWYLTGANESVAIFFTDAIKNGKEDKIPSNAPSSGNIPHELENAISQFGLDPANEYDLQKRSMFYITTNFFYTGGDPPGVQFVLFGDKICPDDNKPYSLRVKNLDFEQKKKNPYAETEIVAATYAVKFMPPMKGEDEGCYYVDVRINLKNELRHLYCPFLRFAIARYQPHTVNPVECANVAVGNLQYGSANGTDCRFSKVTLTDFVQLLPYRKLALKEKSLKYSGYALRTSAPEGPEPKLKLNNILYYYRDLHGLKGEPLLIPLNVGSGPALETPAAQPMETSSKDGSFSFPVTIGESGGSFVIEEYEKYYSPEALVDVSDPREDHRQRLILSYIFDKK